jgi:hypothetical protein
MKGGTLDRRGHVLEVEDTFRAASLDEGLWLPRYLPHWTTGDRSRARYRLEDRGLVLRIEADQPAWSPEYTAELRVSSLQTGAFAGPKGSRVGQHRFRDDLVVREAVRSNARYTPRYGLFELRARFSDDPTTMSALWMIGYEDEPDRSAEICIVEIFGRNVRPDGVGIGMGVHPFHDPSARDEFSVEDVAIDAREAHWYAAEWTPHEVAFYVDDGLVKVVRQSPSYPMQLMLGIFEFRSPADRGGHYPKEFMVEAFRAHRPRELAGTRDLADEPVTRQRVRPGQADRAAETMRTDRLTTAVPVARTNTRPRDISGSGVAVLDGVVRAVSYAVPRYRSL